MPEMHLNTPEDPANAVQWQLFDNLIEISPAHTPETTRWHLHRTSAQPSLLKQSCRKNLLITTLAHSLPKLKRPFFPSTFSNSSFLNPFTSAFSSCNSRVLICQAFHPWRPSNLLPICPAPKASPNVFPFPPISQLHLSSCLASPNLTFLLPLTTFWYESPPTDIQGGKD